MKIIYKYPVKGQLLELEIPKDAEVLTVQVQHGSPCVWVLLDLEAPTIKRRFLLLGTGMAVKDSFCKDDYIDTFQLENGFLVLHLFEPS